MKKNFILTLLLVVLACTFSLQTVMAFDLQDLKPDGLDYSMQYTHSSKNRLLVNGYSFYDFIIIGKLEVKEVKSEALTQLLTAKYNITPNLDFNLKVPFKYKKESIISYTDNQSNDFNIDRAEDFGIGDIELTLNRNTNPSKNVIDVGFMTLKTSTGSSPYDLNNDEVPLGTGHVSFKCGLTRALRLDPVMLFGTSSYCINLDKKINNIVIDPGDTFQYSLGLAYALNNRLLFNSRLEHSIIGDSAVDGEIKSDSGATIAHLYFGLNYVNDNEVNYKYTLGIGLTEDSPDFSFTLSRPINF